MKAAYSTSQRGDGLKLAAIVSIVPARLAAGLPGTTRSAIAVGVGQHAAQARGKVFSNNGTGGDARCSRDHDSCEGENIGEAHSEGCDAMENVREERWSRKGLMNVRAFVAVFILILEG